jgi:hypothetical protein
MAAKAGAAPPSTPPAGLLIMQLFECQRCSQTLFFENTSCERCGSRLGYLAADERLLSLEPDGELWRPIKAPDRAFRFCANAAHDVCNWLVRADSSEQFCECCRHNHVIPDLSVPGNLVRWQRIETAKRRLFYSLLRLRLPLPTRDEDPAGLVFDFRGEDPSGGEKVLTGHDSGLITLNIAEADDALREQRREWLSEMYRTLLGHFRHEIGHFYWDRLVRDGPPGTLERCRELFGDETEDYGGALKRHYENGPAPDWPTRCISAYAASHPWEDFAETWAHYLHIVDTLNTAAAFGASLQPGLPKSDVLEATIDFDAYRVDDIQKLLSAWLPLSVAVNSLNRSMGLPDLYPFVMPPPVVEKLAFVLEIVRTQGWGRQAAPVAAGFPGQDEMAATGP